MLIPLCPVARAVLADLEQQKTLSIHEQIAWIAQEVCARMLVDEPKACGAMPVVVGAGFTGNACSECGNMRMVRTGVCETCLDCGSSSGGCS